MTVIGKYESVANYLKFVTENYRIGLVINDFIGFLSVDADLAEVFKPYLVHKNPFCMYIKSDRTLWDRCIRMKRGILIKSQVLKKPFFGMCYCGVGEYILPIICSNKVIGVLCAGEFRIQNELSFYRIGKIAETYALDQNELENKFLASTHPTILDAEMVANLLGIVCEFLSSFYSSLISTHQELNLKQAKLHSNEAYILSHAIEFIRQNYCEKIGVKDISAFCHCSESYINHIFKKNVKVNVKAFMNKLRVEQAKNYLVNSNDTIAEISLNVGFADPNYFSNVFCKTVGIPPTEFRKRFHATA